MKYALRIPDHYAEEIRALKGDSSINQFIVTAVVEKIATLKTLDYLKQRAERGDEPMPCGCWIRLPASLHLPQTTFARKFHEAAVMRLSP